MIYDRAVDVYLQGLLRMTRFLRKSPPLRQTAVFFFVARNERSTLAEIAKGVSAPEKIVLDDLLDLSNTAADGTAGARLVEPIAAPVEDGRHEYQLTARGRSAFENVGLHMHFTMLPDGGPEVQRRIGPGC